MRTACPKRKKNKLETSKSWTLRRPRQKSKQNASIRSIQCNRGRGTRSRARKNHCSQAITQNCEHPDPLGHYVTYTVRFLDSCHSSNSRRAHDGLPSMDACQPPSENNNALCTVHGKRNYNLYRRQLSINWIAVARVCRRCRQRLKASGSVFLPSATWRARRNWLAHCMVIPGRILFELNYIMKLNRTAKVKSHPCAFCCGETGRVAAPAQRTPTSRRTPCPICWDTACNEPKYTI